MNQLRVAGVDKSFSRIGLGCMRLSPEREPESFALLDEYLSRGGNLLDTAEVYGRGNSERAIGNYFRARGGRAGVVIVTKGCVEPHLVRPEYIRLAIDRSLERLQMDKVDVYLLHRDDPTIPVDELLDVLNGAVDQGRIGAFGGSNWTTRRLEQANRAAQEKGQRGFVVSSPHLALATPREPWWAGCTHATQEDVRWYAATQTVVLAWSSQCRGFFAQDPPSDPAYLAELIRVYYSRENLEKRQRLLRLSGRLRVSPGQLAVAYVLSLEALTAALVGPLTVQELSTLLQASDIRLDSQQRGWLELSNSHNGTS